MPWHWFQCLILHSAAGISSVKIPRTSTWWWMRFTLTICDFQALFQCKPTTMHWAWVLCKSDLTPWVCYIRAYISTQQTTYLKVRSEITSRFAGLGLVALSLSMCYQCGLSPGKKSVRKLTPVPQFDFSIFKFLFTKQIASTMPAFSQLQFTLFLFLLISSPCRLNADALN